METPDDKIRVHSFPTNVDQNLRPLFLEMHKRIDALEDEIAKLKGKPNPPKKFQTPYTGPFPRPAGK